MAEITIHMVFNKQSGKKDIHIHYDSDQDALPFEHEKAHREVVEQLLGKGILRPDELGAVKVERSPARNVTSAEAEEHGTEQPLKQGH
ncbi:MAG: hypothetical protein RBU37_13390 [Myxococcota bacterium]|nr:hypothetical protein [Myxococcota bacterium]